MMSTTSTSTMASSSSSTSTSSALVAIVCRLTEDLRERCYTLQLVVDNIEDKMTFLRTVCRHVSNTLCRPDPDQLLVRLAARDMSLDASDLNVSSFSKALSSFHKTKQKVGRAFSFNKTPSKMKRAVSSMISPMASRTNTELREARHNQNTPSESMRELRLESTRTTPLTSRAGSAQSCVDLMDTETPRGSKVLPSPGKDSLDSENRDPGFRTPILCSRPSFRDKFRARPRAGTLGGFIRKGSMNM